MKSLPDMKHSLSILILLCSLAGWMSCGGDSGRSDERPVDSQMVAEHVDPSTKFPQQLVETDTLQIDRAFVDNAIQSAWETIALTDLAIQKATHTSVKEAAQTMARDYRQLYASLLRQKQEQRKADNDSLKKFTDGSREALEKLSGAAFDRQWTEKMVTRNAATISRYEAEAAAAKNKDIRKLADEALPVMKTHQQQLETCRTKLQ